MSLNLTVHILGIFRFGSLYFVSVEASKDYDSNDQVDDVFLTTFESGHETFKGPPMVESNGLVMGTVWKLRNFTQKFCFCKNFVKLSYQLSSRLCCFHEIFFKVRVNFSFFYTVKKTISQQSLFSSLSLFDQNVRLKSIHDFFV